MGQTSRTGRRGTCRMAPVLLALAGPPVPDMAEAQPLSASGGTDTLVKCTQ